MNKLIYFIIIALIVLKWAEELEIQRGIYIFIFSKNKKIPF